MVQHNQAFDAVFVLKSKSSSLMRRELFEMKSSAEKFLDANEVKHKFESLASLTELLLALKNDQVKKLFYIFAAWRVS